MKSLNSLSLKCRYFSTLTPPPHYPCTCFLINKFNSNYHHIFNLDICKTIQAGDTRGSPPTSLMYFDLTSHPLFQYFYFLYLLYFAVQQKFSCLLYEIQSASHLPFVKIAYLVPSLRASPPKKIF